MSNAKQNLMVDHTAALFDDCIGIMRQKNQAYANNSDPLKNFRAYALAGVSVPQGITLRMIDKFSRIQNLLQGANPGDESIHDTISDLINYAAILDYAIKTGEHKPTEGRA